MRDQCDKLKEKISHYRVISKSTVRCAHRGADKGASLIWSASSLNDLLPGLRKMRGIHGPSLGERRVPYGRDHERHAPDRGRAFHFDWNTLNGARDLGSAQPMRGL
jgi:hypothetical protein